jgi:hypothetical protein
VVTANFGEYYFIQNGEGPWNGMFIYDPGRNPSIGDSLVVTGLVEEYYEKTEIKEVSGYYHISSNNDLPEPVIIDCQEAGEAYESVLVKVVNAICTDDEYQANFYMWTVNDGTGDMLVHNTSIFEFEPVLGETYDITGPLNYDHEEWKIEIRHESDVADGTDIFPPNADEVVTVNDNQIKITFSEIVNETTATDIQNYTVNNNITVEGAEMHSFLGNVVFLNVSDMATGTYILTINGVEDPSGNMMEDVETEFYHESTGIDEITGISEISVYPNPAGETITMNLVSAGQSDVSINILDLSGKVLISNLANLKQGINQVSFSNHQLKGGISFIEVEKGNQKTHLKLIVR